jgi:hypothetical protein
MGVYLLLEVVVGNCRGCRSGLTQPFYPCGSRSPKETPSPWPSYIIVITMAARRPALVSQQLALMSSVPVNLEISMISSGQPS